MAECARILHAVDNTLDGAVHFGLDDASAANALAMRMAEACIQN